MGTPPAPSLAPFAPSPASLYSPNRLTNNKLLQLVYNLT